MDQRSYDLHGIRVFECAPDGPLLANDQDAAAIIGEAIAHAARLIVIPTTRLDPKFFQLRTRLAGEFVQKFVNYRLRLVIVGDLSEAAAESTARAFIEESNRGDQAWFLRDMSEVEQRLAMREGS